MTWFVIIYTSSDGPEECVAESKTSDIFESHVAFRCIVCDRGILLSRDWLDVKSSCAQHWLKEMATRPREQGIGKESAWRHHSSRYSILTSGFRFSQAPKESQSSDSYSPAAYSIMHYVYGIELFPQKIAPLPLFFPLFHDAFLALVYVMERT